MAIYELDGISPELGGRVHLGKNANVWPQVVIRGDNEPIRIGAGTNIQDAAVLHSDYGWPLTLGENVSIGHQAMVHGCTIGDGSLIGINAIVLNGAKIGKNCLVGAGALVTEGKEFPDGSLIIGSPAKAVKNLSPEQIAEIDRISTHYVDNAMRYRIGLKKIT
ncbi:MAG: gamma carbonic anhydrase family protein [Burkholderiaceae bacterium]|nr:gamma carbonic anhydrase family protein [Burkholderiaceae bacterium]